MFVNYYSIIEGYGNELTAGISIMTISFCILFISLGFGIALRNVNETDKILSALVLVFVFGISVAFSTIVIPLINEKRANEVLTKNNLDKSFIENANVLLDIYDKNDNKEDKVKKSNSGTAVIELDKGNGDFEIITVPYGIYVTVILNKYYNDIDVRDNTELYSDGLLKMGINSYNSLDFSGVTAMSEEIDSLYENSSFGYEAVKSVLK
jgi:hypothetical protein